MTSSGDTPAKVVYWHQELPPLDGELIHEHVIEAVSDRVRGAIERHGELWHRCYGTLMEHTRLRLEQEVTRLGGNYAHVIDEHIDSQRDDANSQSWLHGRFSYVLYRRNKTGASATTSKPSDK
jgi:hypothetical protein